MCVNVFFFHNDGLFKSIRIRKFILKNSVNTLKALIFANLLHWDLITISTYNLSKILEKCLHYLVN